MITSLALIVMMTAVTVGTSIAVFSDQESIPGNTVSMGTLDLVVNKSIGKPFSVTNAYPGYVYPTWEYADLFNNGSLPLEAHMTFSHTDGSADLYNYLTIDLRTSGWDSICGNGDDTVIWNGLIKDIPNQLQVSHYGYYVHANEDDGSGPNDNIRPGYSLRLCQKVGVHIDAGNSVMGQSVTFAETFDAYSDND